jgi:hypothetical protein
VITTACCITYCNGACRGYNNNNKNNNNNNNNKYFVKKQREFVALVVQHWAHAPYYIAIRGLSGCYIFFQKLERKSKDTLCPITPPTLLENLRVFEVIWRNMVEPDRPRMAI